MTLRLDWATHESAAFACENWHYSKIHPTGKLVKVGAWENGNFIGVVIFSRGASPWLPKKFGLPVTEICELTRIALKEHDAPVSRILSLSIKFLRKFCPGIRLIVSFADPSQGHHGGIYQATNWVYSGTSNETVEYFVRGRWRHTRGVYHEVKGRPEFPSRIMPGKHRYLFPLDPKLSETIEALRVPYPKRAGSKAIVASPYQGEEGGETPTPALPTLPDPFTGL